MQLQTLLTIFLPLKQLLIPLPRLILQLSSQTVPAEFLRHHICYKLLGDRETESLSEAHCTSTVHRYLSPAFNLRAKIGKSQWPSQDFQR